MRQQKTSIIAGIVALTLAGPAFAQVGGGNELPSSATRPSGAGGTSSTPQNNGVAAPGTGAGGSAATGGSPMGTGGATSSGTGVTGRGQ